MPKEQSAGKPTTRRYSAEEKAAAVRMVRTLRSRVGHRARNDPAGRQPVGLRGRVGAVLGAPGRHRRRAAPGVSTAEAARIKELEQENRELKRANEILKRAATFFGAELDRQHKK